MNEDILKEMESEAMADHVKHFMEGPRLNQLSPIRLNTEH
jgi:hypothetical protein